MKLRSYDGSLDGRRYRLIGWEGLRVRVFDDAATALKIIDLLNDRTVVAHVKADIAAALLFPDPQAVAARVSDVEGLIAECVKEVALVDMRGGGDGADKVIDLEQDAEIIYASLWNAYGMPFEDMARKATLEEVLGIMSCVPHETPLGQALYYRTAEPPKRTKYNEGEIREFRKRQKFWKLKAEGGGEPDAAGNDAMTAMFDSLGRQSHGERGSAHRHIAGGVPG